MGLSVWSAKKQLRGDTYGFMYEEWEGKHDWYFFSTALEWALKKFVLRMQTL